MEENRNFLRNLDPILIDSLRWYSQDKNYKTFNDHMRNNFPLSSLYVYHRDNIDSIFSLVPPLKETNTVFKGKRSDKIFSDKTYISTSTSYDIAKRMFSNNRDCCVMYITVPPGSKVLFLDEVSDYSEEDEVLLDRDGTMTLTGEGINSDGMKLLYVTYIPNQEQEFMEIENEINEMFDF